MQEKEKIVSVCVLTYNSSSYVLETLESVKEQTYPYIELIISDDASSDDTVKKCRQWVGIYRQRFLNVVILTVRQNTGIPANINRSVRAARGEWIKNIAGDDALLPDCITDYMNFIGRNPQVRICHSVSRKYAYLLDETHFLGTAYPRRKMIEPDISAEKQYRLLQTGCWILAPTVFIRKELIETVGYYDESIPLCEDWPMWLKITGKGYKIDFLDKETVKYRINTSSISHNKSRKLISDRQYEVLLKVYINYLAGHLSLFLKLEKKYMLKLYLNLEKYKLNDNRCLFNVFLFYLLSFPLSVIANCRYIYLTGWKLLVKESWSITQRCLKKRILK